MFQIILKQLINYINFPKNQKYFKGAHSIAVSFSINKTMHHTSFKEVKMYVSSKFYDYSAFEDKNMIAIINNQLMQISRQVCALIL